MIFACMYIIGNAWIGFDALRFEILIGPEADDQEGTLKVTGGKGRQLQLVGFLRMDVTFCLYMYLGGI